MRVWIGRRGGAVDGFSGDRRNMRWGDLGRGGEERRIRGFLGGGG